MWELLKQGGVVMYPLGFCSLLTLAILLERLVRFSRADRDPEVVIRQAEVALKTANSPPKWQDEPAPSIRAVATAFASRGMSPERVEERVRAALSSEALRLSAHVSIVGTIGNIAPFIGLFGTVLGIIRAFRDIGQVGAAGPAVVATGISEALVATAAGLFVAISSVIAYNLLITWQSRIMRRAEITATQVVDMVAEH
jgi:biopolymer transport protein ExbB